MTELERLSGAADAGRAAGLEEAAKLADEWAENTTGSVAWTARQLAKEIRAKAATGGPAVGGPGSTMKGSV